MQAVENKNLKASSNLLNPYNFESFDSDVSYHFTTDGGIQYSLALGDYSDLFGLTDSFECRIFFFVVTRLNRPKKAFIDRRIRDTIIHFSMEYLDKNPNIIYYVCSNLDNKERARQAMFDEWFESSGRKDIRKEKRIIEEGEGYFLFKENNQLAIEILGEIDKYINLP